jgi:hypothetical protein
VAWLRYGHPTRSDPYGLARRYGSIVVADAAGNDVLKVVIRIGKA